jgi:hypothetical protein
MGLSSIDVPHLAIGGMPDLPSADLSKSALQPANSRGDSASAGHHSVDLRTDHGTFRMMAPEDTMRHLGAAAQKAKRYSTGPKPSWYGGGGRSSCARSLIKAVRSICVGRWLARAGIFYFKASPSARQHNGNVSRCQNSQGTEKTDGNSQEQAAVLHDFPFGFSLRVRS